MRNSMKADRSHRNSRARPATTGWFPPWMAVAVIFGVALALRLLFLHATPDSSWPGSSYYRGDAFSWLEYARAIRDGTPYEMRLPTKPPGTAYLFALLGTGVGTGVVFAKFVWCVMGAAAVALFYFGWRRAFGARVAGLAGLLAATGTGLLILSTSLNNETPYLLLVSLCFLLLQKIRERPTLQRLAAWSVLNALACLVRVEHVLFFVPATGFLLWWMRPSGARSSNVQPGAGSWRSVSVRGAILALCFVVPLLPWQIVAARNTARVNRIPQPSSEALPEFVRRLEQSLGSLEFGVDAERVSKKLPGFVRRLATDFVAATVLHRGAGSLGAEDFVILDEAFGYRPEPLARFPFITSYGPLNFHLANNSHATGGFNRLALDDPPPLAGGRDRYPADLLLDQPPPGVFSLDYPPHLRAYNHGYALGWDWIRRHPALFPRLVARKLAIFWSGAALGFTGYDFPAGVSGVQRAVDMVVPEGWIALVWRVLVLATCVLGIAAGRRNPMLWPWLLFFGSKLVITVAFFGYARIGASVTPVVFLLVALATDRHILGRAWKPGPVRSARWNGEMRWAAGLIGLVLLVECLRFASNPRILVDGQPIEAGDPFAGPVHVERRVDVR